MANYEGNVDYSGIECSGECLDLLMKCLKVDPHKRITAREALTHSFIIGENHI
jgi:serine/threonine protein kinase